MFDVGRSALGVGCFVCPDKSAFCSKHGARAAVVKKCYNFMLAMPAPGAAYCISNRTATLLLVVDCYSQVVGAAVHQYSHLIRNLNPPSPP